jgi:beta-RFAP synthase
MPLADTTQTELPAKGLSGTQRASQLGGVRVVAPARLHLGFLDLNGDLGRLFGSIGLAIDRPATEIVLAPARSFQAEGPDRVRALAMLRRYAEALSPGSAYRLDVRSVIPPHAGLGSGTQLALAIGAAIAELEGLQRGAEELGELAERGARSAIGMAAFATGGFIVDGGRGAKDCPPPILLRAHFPEAWRILLILDGRSEGVHGDDEAKAFSALPALPDTTAAHVCRLVLMQLVPGLMEADIDAFGAALTEIQAIVGGHFAAAQGGSPWTSPAVGHIAEKAKEAGAIGIGQSSWGPTGFAFTPSKENAQRLYDSLIGEARAEGLEILIAQGRNRGALVEQVAGTQNERNEGQ